MREGGINAPEHELEVGADVADSASDLMKSEQLLLLAQGIVEQTSGFFEKKGPGVADHATGVFVHSCDSGRMSVKEAHSGRQARSDCATQRASTEGNCGTCREAV